MADARQQALFDVPPPAYDSPTDFADAAIAAIRSVARRKAELTTDDVWEALTDYTMRERRVLGGAMLRAAAAGWIVKTDRVVPTRQPQANSRPIAVWHSRLFGGTAP